MQCRSAPPLTLHMITTNIATLNINGISSTIRMQMLRNFINPLNAKLNPICHFLALLGTHPILHVSGIRVNKHDINILLMQEVTHPSLDNLNGYTVHYNIGTSQRGTSIAARDNIQLSNITRMPSGRAIAAEFKGIWLVNIYAPSGAAKRNEREQFFSSDLTYILRAALENIILGGDFNCVLDKSDTTGHFNPLKPELNPICYLLALLGAHHFLHVSRIRVKLLTLR